MGWHNDTALFYGEKSKGLGRTAPLNHKKTYKKTRLDIYICKSTLTLSEFSPQSTGRDLAGSPWWGYKAWSRRGKKTLWVEQRCHLQVNRQKCIRLTVCRGFVWRPKRRPQRRACHQPECRPHCSHPADKTVKHQITIISYKWQDK